MYIKPKYEYAPPDRAVFFKSIMPAANTARWPMALIVPKSRVLLKRKTAAERRSGMAKIESISAGILSFQAGEVVHVNGREEFVNPVDKKSHDYHAYEYVKEYCDCHKKRHAS